jgi:predicted RNase H-related nuclease YkuK (DUF458 family)
VITVSKGYFNSTSKNMNLNQVADNILSFIQSNPNGYLKLMVGTDSQLIKTKTCFATGIVIHNMGNGAWCCVNKSVVTRKIRSLSEKIHMETSMTYQVICDLNEMLTEDILEILLPYKSTFNLEAHIDVGRKGATRVLIREMLGYFEGIGIQAKIKPYSFVASTYANKYSKAV